MSSAKQAHMGCSGCLYAGYSNERCYAGTRPLSASEFKRLSKAGYGFYYCLQYDKPVRSEQGHTCPRWKDDLTYT